MVITGIKKIMNWNDIFVGQNASVKGEVREESNLFISGQIDGTVYTEKDITVYENGIVKGDITSTNFDLSGTMEGEVKAKKIHLLKSAKLLGDLTTSTLVVDEGATFIGTSKKRREKLDSKIDKFEPTYEI